MARYTHNGQHSEGVQVLLFEIDFMEQNDLGFAGSARAKHVADGELVRALLARSSNTEERMQGQRSSTRNSKWTGKLLDDRSFATTYPTVVFLTAFCDLVPSPHC